MWLPSMVEVEYYLWHSRRRAGWIRRCDPSLSCPRQWRTSSVETEMAARWSEDRSARKTANVAIFIPYYSSVADLANTVKARLNRNNCLHRSVGTSYKTFSQYLQLREYRYCMPWKSYKPNGNLLGLELEEKQSAIRQVKSQGAGPVCCGAACPHRSGPQWCSQLDQGWDGWCRRSASSEWESG